MTEAGTGEGGEKAPEEADECFAGGIEFQTRIHESDLRPFTTRTHAGTPESQGSSFMDWGVGISNYSEI